MAIRQPIITILGHVDHGKTQLLDTIRGTSIVEREAGRITQHIGATEIPIHVVEKIAGDLLKKYGFKVKIPGLLFIDTPGHEAFTNLRKRGGSIADLAVLIVDINQGIQPQTIEAIDILKSYKTPFIIAANKVDNIQGWYHEKGSITDSLKRQNPKILEEIDRKIYELVGKIYEKGFESERYDRVSDFTKQIPIVPISALKNEGIPELLMFLSGLSQKYMEKKLEISPEELGKGTVLEVKEEKGLGKTIDVLLYDGTIKQNDQIAFNTKNGVVITKVRALLKPKPMDEIRDPKDKFQNVKEITAASGLKIAAPNLGDAMAGSGIRVLDKDQSQIKELESEFESVMFESEDVGVTVKADTIGALEGIKHLLDLEKIPIKKADIGDVSKKDIMEVESVQEKDRFLGVLLAFNTKIDESAREEAKLKKVQIFEDKVIYNLLDQYTKWSKEEKEKEKNEKMGLVTLPAVIKFLPGCCFHNAKPAVVGVRVMEGTLRDGAKLFNDKGNMVGKVISIQEKNKSIKQACLDSEVAVSIDSAVIGRSICENDILYTYIPQRDLENLRAILDDEGLELLNKILIKQKELFKKDEE